MSLPVKELVSAATLLLSSFATDPAPWTRMEANSEQRQPVYLGRTPRELALGLPSPKNRAPAIPESMDALAKSQVRALLRNLPEAAKEARVEFELWPVLNDDGNLTWAIARWRPGSRAQGLGPRDVGPGSERAWRWLRADSTSTFSGIEPPPELPVTADPLTPSGRSRIFDDVLTLKDLYDKPLFGNCIWTDREGGRVLAAWLPPAETDRYREPLTRHEPPLLCRAVSQPARLDAKPVTFVLSKRGETFEWSRKIVWTGRRVGARQAAKPAVEHWPYDYAALFRDDVLTLSGEKGAVFPDGKKIVRFTKKNNAQPDNQLEEVVDYLAERYRSLGIETRRQTFLWRGRKHSNLIAVIPGAHPRHPAEDRPIILADHIDTAFCEDEFSKSGLRAQGRGRPATGLGRRVSAPGADDNATATAALLRAADVLGNLRLRRDVWLVHLTGEEFPADDLGARQLVGSWLKGRQDIGGAVVLDMIGFRKPGDRIVQINAGDSEASLGMADAAVSAAGLAAPGLLDPKLRTRFDPRSYLYNTDGLIFSHSGYPVILINEHINKLENMDRPHYHQTTDTSGTLDWDYAVAVSKAAVETVAELAGAAPPALPAGALPVPIIRQAHPYSCGAAALLSALYYWRAYDGGESSLYAETGTNPDKGTEPQGIVDGAKKHGLDASFKENVSLDEMKSALRRGETAILDIQAWPDRVQSSTTPWSRRWEDGHYVVLVGLDQTNAYFMDPSTATGYTFIPLSELWERWHDYEDRPPPPASRQGPGEGRTTSARPHGAWRNYGLAVFIRGKAHVQSFPGPPSRTQ